MHNCGRDSPIVVTPIERLETKSIKLPVGLEVRVHYCDNGGTIPANVLPACASFTVSRDPWILRVHSTSIRKEALTT